MAHNPHVPQGPDGQQDPAGSTQMFRAFVEEEGPRRQAAAAPVRSGPGAGVIIGVVVVLAVIAAAAWLALG